MKFPPWFQRGTSMWFVAFMQAALYHPTYGYYTRASSPFGQAGDFVTAPELTPLFGQTLARACAGALASFDEPVIFEFGAGSGRLCVDILSELEKMGSLPTSYVILELSHALKTCQQQLIQTHLPHLLSRVQWIKTWPQQAFQGVVIANEVLDAMPVHRFKVDEADIFESMIEHTDSGELQEVWRPCPHERIVQHVQSRTASLKKPYLSECNGLLEDWILGCSKMLDKGLILLIDYGFPAHEYYHEDRNMGTIMCHFKHHAHGAFLEHIGEQDITAHVDFTHVAEAAEKAGLTLAWFSNQASFLLEHGLLDVLSSISDNASRFAANQHVMQLVSPSEMGELFKVMMLTKAYELPFKRQSRYDKRGSL